jgi:phosphatidylglycerol lysyltransferase
VGAKEWTLDLVRITNTAPSGTAQLLITNAIEAAKSDAIRRLSLAAAPIDPVAHLSNSQRIIGHYQDHGLRRFKAAFDPRWEPLYMLAPNRFHLTFCALCLLVAIKSPNQSSRTS